VARQIKNEVGNRYGRLVVLEEVGRDKYNQVIWNCKCDCGNYKIVRGYSLRKGNTSSCGCINIEKSSKIHKIDEIGNRYGRLMVLKEAGNSKDGHIQWLCGCDCGNKKVVVGRDLRSTSTKSCGCFRRETSSESCLKRFGEKGPFFGKKHSIASRNKMSKNHVGLYGENNPAWNPNITDAERVNRRHIPGYHEWRLAIYERDNYTCQCCGDNKGGNLNAHHLESYSKNKELRINLDNGITMCKCCHNSFHYQFGFRGNTTEQFVEFLKKARHEKGIISVYK